MTTAPHVLDVGQCNPDHGSIRSLLESLGAAVSRAHTIAEAKERLARERFDLVLVNRIFDADGSEGMRLVEHITALSGEERPPVMLVSNYQDAQAAAVELGALPGFGKNALRSPETRTRLEQVLKR
jgi:DNA-binding NtrC family response regulator